MPHSFLQKLKKYCAICSVAGMLFFIYLLITAYIGLYPLCKISIESDMVSGNKKAIVSAIKMVKKERKQEYKTLCKYVDQIIENDCLAVEPRIDSSWKGLNADGCYIRGSKTIYIKPEKNGDAESVAKRFRAILRSAEYSKKFWDEKEK